MTEDRIIEHIRAMTDPAEVDKQLEEVREASRKIASLVGSELSAAWEWLKSSTMMTPEDLDGEVQGLDLADKGRRTQRILARYEEELIERKEQLAGK